MKIMSSLFTDNIRDLRKFAELESIIEIKNKDLFVNNMELQGYKEKFDNVLVKYIDDNEEIDEINIILSVSDTFNVNNIIYYKDNKSVEMDPNFENEIINTINEANQ